MTDNPKCPACNRKTRKTNTGLICVRCGHVWESNESQVVPSKVLENVMIDEFLKEQR